MENCIFTNFLYPECDIPARAIKHEETISPQDIDIKYPVTPVLNHATKTIFNDNIINEFKRLATTIIDTCSVALI